MSLATPPTPTSPGTGVTAARGALPAVAGVKTKSYSMEEATRRQAIFTYVLLALGSLMFLIPFYFVVNGSLKTEAEVQANALATPPSSLAAVQWSNYPRALDK